MELPNITLLGTWSGFCFQKCMPGTAHPAAGILLAVIQRQKGDQGLCTPHGAVQVCTEAEHADRLTVILPWQEFVPVARELEGNWTRFTPHYIVWVCPESYRASDECQSQCIHNGRYCTPDPDGDLQAGYSGRDIVQVRSLSVAPSMLPSTPALQPLQLLGRLLPPPKP